MSTSNQTNIQIEQLSFLDIADFYFSIFKIPSHGYREILAALPTLAKYDRVLPKGTQTCFWIIASFRLTSGEEEYQKLLQRFHIAPETVLGIPKSFNLNTIHLYFLDASTTQSYASQSAMKVNRGYRNGKKRPCKTRFTPYKRNIN